MRVRSATAILLAMALFAAACGDDEVTDGSSTTVAPTTVAPTTIAPTTTTTAPAALGTTERPIEIVFAPIGHAATIETATSELAAELLDRTGLIVRISVSTSLAGAVTGFCDDSERSVAILPAEAYAVAHDVCAADAALVAIRGGESAYWSQILVARDSDLLTLADLDGLVWAYPGDGSPSGYLIPNAMLAAGGVTPGGRLETAGHPAAVAAVYEGAADFATTRFSPAVTPDGTTAWDGSLEGTDIPADLIDTCGIDDGGDLACGSLRPRDARRGLRELYPDVIQKVRILAVSEPVPNELVVFGSEFPDDARTRVMEALLDLVTDDFEAFTEAFKPYAWEGLDVVNEFDLVPLRSLLATIGFGIDDL